MYNILKEKGRLSSDYYAGKQEYFSLTPTSKTLLEVLEPLVAMHCRGMLLDAGAGRGAYRDILLKHADQYVGIDITASQRTSVVGDIQILPFPEATFDTVFCSQVLEHVPEPWLALAEFRRILKPGGYLILTAPHISWLHNEPHDYYRYTQYGLEFLLAEAQLRLEKVVPAGGLFSLLGHVPSTFWINVTFGIPWLHSLVRKINTLWVEVVSCMDRNLEKKKLFALNYVCVAQKQGQETETL